MRNSFLNYEYILPNSSGGLCQKHNKNVQKRIDFERYTILSSDIVHIHIALCIYSYILSSD